MFFKIVLFFVKISGKASSFIRVPPRVRKSFMKKEVEFFNSTNLEGYIILTHINWQLSNIFIDGYWDHVQLIGSNKNIIEASSHGVRETTILEGLKNKDDYIILKPIFAGQKQRHLVVDEALSLIGNEYDYTFAKDNESWYCSEIIWSCYEKILKYNPFKIRIMEICGEKVEMIQPIDFYRANSKWDVVFRKPC